MKRNFSSSIVAIVLSLATLSGATSAKAETVPGKKHVPDAVSNGLAVYVSHADPKQEYELAIALPVKNQADLDKLVADQQDHNSPVYHQWLSVEQFADRFAPSKADYAEVVNYLKGQGFTIELEHANRLAVSFTGNTEQIERAFHVTMNNYKHPLEDRTFYAPDVEPTLTGLKVPVLLIAGLDNYVLPHPKLRKNPRAPEKPEAVARKANVTTRAASLDCYGPPYTVNVGTGGCGTYTPNDLRTAYYGGTALTGSGQEIGILAFDSGASAEDLAAQAEYDNATVPTVNYILGKACTKSSCENDDGEQVLDIIFSYNFAPGVKINFFESSNDLTMINAEASSTVSSVYSCSWGWGFSNHAAEDTDFEEMATQGQTFLNATGDDGGYNSETWSYPSGDPYVIGVGGTQLVTTTNGGPWSAEYGWPYSGGGVPPTADSYTQPSWQTGVGNATNGVSTTKRSDPDVASEADFEMLGCEADVCEDTYGGTSYAAPTWAAIFAMVNQASVAAGNGTVGFVNPQLYAAGENATYQNVFHDVTGCGGIDSGEETGPDCNSSDEGTPVQGYNPVTGYDGVTGWGSPNVTNLVTELTVPTLVIAGCGAGCDRASSITFTINFPELSGTSTFTATPSGSMTATTIGTCTMASSTCSLTVLGSAIGVGTFTIQTYYADTRTTPTTNRYSATQIITIAADATNTAVTANPSTIPSTSSTSLTATVTDTTITNTVPAGTVNFSEGATALGSCTLSGGTCSITVSGSTLGVGTDTVTATYVPGSNLCGASSGTTTVTVTASGAITFSSVNHNMGSETIGSTSSAYGVEMTNTSSTTVTYTGITISTSASPNPFKMVTNCGTSLAAGKNCEIEFTYAPVSGDSGTETATWSLAGTPNGTTFSPSNGGTLTGTVASSGSVTLTTAGHNFGDQTVGTTSGTYGTVLTNSTNAAITLTKGSVTSPFNSITNCGTTLAAGASCNLDFTFSPTTTGLVQQVYSLSANGGAVPILVGGNPTTGITLTGTGD